MLIFLPANIPKKTHNIEAINDYTPILQLSHSPQSQPWCIIIFSKKYLLGLILFHDIYSYTKN
jgi:hypothetical protein